MTQSTVSYELIARGWLDEQTGLHAFHSQALAPDIMKVAVQTLASSEKNVHVMGSAGYVTSSPRTPWLQTRSSYFLSRAQDWLAGSFRQ